MPPPLERDNVLYNSMEKLNLNPSSHIEPAPGKTALDYAVAVAKVGSMAFPPFAGGVAFIDYLTAPFRGKRMNNRSEEIRLGLNAVSQSVEGLTPERLVENDAFISAFAHATQAVLKTHQAEKREALRNAVLNVAAGTAPSDDLQLIFLNLVDSFTPNHLRVLALLSSKDRSGFARGRRARPSRPGAVQRHAFQCVSRSGFTAAKSSTELLCSPGSRKEVLGFHYSPGASRISAEIYCCAGK